MTEALELMKSVHEKFKDTNEKIKEFEEQNKGVGELKTAQERMQDELDALEQKFADAEKKSKLEVKQENAEVEFAEIKEWIGKDSKGKITILDREYKSINTEINTDGGYWIKPSYSNRIIKNIEETSPIRAVATIERVPAGTTELMVYRELDEAETCGWVTERATRTATETPETGLVRIPLHQIYAEPKLTTKAIKNPSFNFERWTRSKVTNKIARTENTAFINGTGVGQPEGILNNATIVANTLTSAASGVVDFDDLIDVQTNLKDMYAKNGVWGFNRLSLRQLRKLVDGNGQYIWQPAGRDGVPATLLGDRYVIMQDIPQIAAGAKSIVYGDWKEGYTIVDGAGMSILRDPYSTHSFITLYFEKETGGMVVQPEALQLLTVKA